MPEMTQSRIQALLFSVAAGVAIGAALLGFMVISIAAASSLQAGTLSMLVQHPLFSSGSKLISSSVISSLPLIAMWLFLRKQ